MPATMITATSQPQEQGKRKLFQGMKRRLSEVVKPSSKCIDMDDDVTHATEPTVCSLEMRTVRFNESVSVRNTRALADYTPAEIEKCWYTAAEFDGIRHNMEKQIRKLNRGEKLRDRKYCSRGLECYVDEAAELRQEYKDLARQAVLDEQYYQQEEGIVDEYTIAAAYLLVSKPCLKKAQKIGQRDAMEVQQKN